MYLTPKRKLCISKSFQNMFTGLDWHHISVDEKYNQFVDSDLIEEWMGSNLWKLLIQDLEEVIHIGSLDFNLDDNDGFHFIGRMNLTSNLNYRKGFKVRRIEKALRRLQVFLNVNHKQPIVKCTITHSTQTSNEFIFELIAPKDFDWVKATNKTYRFMMSMMLFKLTYMSE